MSYFYDNGIPDTEDDFHEELRQQMLARVTTLVRLLESRAEMGEDQWNVENRVLAMQEIDQLYQLAGLPSCSDLLKDFENQEDA
mgnify:CR=1 FL=1